MNLADVGPKLKACASRWESFVSTGISHISFLGRKRAREALEAEKLRVASIYVFQINVNAVHDCNLRVNNLLEKRVRYC